MRRNKTFRYILVVDEVKWTVVGFSHSWLNCYEGWNGNREHGNNEWNTMGGKMVNGDTCKRNDRYQTSDTSTAKNRKGKLQEATPTEQIETEEWTSQWRPARRGAQWYVRSLEARPPSGEIHEMGGASCGQRGWSRPRSNHKTCPAGKEKIRGIRVCEGVYWEGGERKNTMKRILWRVLSL